MRGGATVLVGLVLVSWCASASAGIGCCSHCGHQRDCNQVCRLVCEEKKVTVTCWGTVCEDFCVGKCSERGCKHREEVCGDCNDSCDPSVPHSVPMPFVWFDWNPNCSAKIYTKKKLMKRTETKKVPSFKWVVEDLCPECENCCPVAQVDAGTQLPEPPRTSARVLPIQWTTASIARPPQSAGRVVDVRPTTEPRPNSFWSRLFR